MEGRFNGFLNPELSVLASYLPAEVIPNTADEGRAASFERFLFCAPVPDELESTSGAVPAAVHDAGTIEFDTETFLPEFIFAAVFERMDKPFNERAPDSFPFPLSVLTASAVLAKTCLFFAVGESGFLVSVTFSFRDFEADASEDKDELSA